ncbi:MAG: DUF1508 domain-containing protein [Gammaproteobacteria bacterium]|nr:DUF1508 domain-containing protein [Gammaproteobacteria bacterium]
MAGKFELYKDVGGRFRFRLLGENGERVLVSDGYAKKVLALEGIVSVLKMAPEARLIDLTVAGNGEIQLTENASVVETLPEQDPEAEPAPAPQAAARRRPLRKKAAVRRRVAKPAAEPAPLPAAAPEAEKAQEKKSKHKKKKSKKRKGKKKH